MLQLQQRALHSKWQRSECFHSSNVPGSKQYALRPVRALPYAYINVSDHCQYAARSSTGSVSNRLAFTLEFSLSQLLRQIID